MTDTRPLMKWKHAIGDRVRVLQDAYEPVVMKGKLGTIEDYNWIDGDGAQCYGVVLDDDPEKFPWALVVGRSVGVDDFEPLLIPPTDEEVKETLASIAKVGRT